MKTALIMGINGGFGSNVAEALARQGWQLRALMRDPAKLPERFKGTEIVKGDASNIDDVREASNNIDLVVYAVNPPNYDWANKALPWLDVTATVAEEKGLNIIFPGNVYSLNPANGPEFDEESIIDPITSKGKMRQAMEARLKTASQNGAKVVIIRCGDFIGKNLPSTWMEYLINKTKRGTKLLMPGDENLIHSWAYLPDVALAVAEITNKLDKLPAFNIFHFKGLQFSLNNLAESIKQVTGKEVVKKKFPWFVIKVMGIFSVLYAGLFEMRYLWKNEINLNDKKLNTLLGHDSAITPLNQVLSENYF